MSTPYLPLNQSPADEQLQAFARYLLNEFACACLDHCVKTDVTCQIWGDLTGDEQAVWKAVARKARLYLAHNPMPSIN